MFNSTESESSWSLESDSWVWKWSQRSCGFTTHLYNLIFSTVSPPRGWSHLYLTASHWCATHITFLLVLLKYWKVCLYIVGEGRDMLRTEKLKRMRNGDLRPWRLICSSSTLPGERSLIFVNAWKIGVPLSCGRYYLVPEQINTLI